MPLDNNGRWIPEPHKADGYSAEDKANAQKLGVDFERAARGVQEKEEAPLILSQEKVHRVLMMELRPDGTALVQRKLPNAQDRKKELDQLYKWSSQHDDRESRRFNKSDLTKVFKQADTNRNRGDELEP